MSAKVFTFPVMAAFLALAMPMLLGFGAEDDAPDLTGIVISKEKPELNRTAWFAGEYQKLRDDYNDDHWSLKEPMVRLNNQLYYDAFNQIRVKGFVSGKENYVFSESYIFSAFGDDLVDESQVQELLRKARVIQDTLKKKNIDLLLVFAPGKGAGCREFVEDKYVHPYTRTNHDVFVEKSAKLGLNTLDLYTYFEQLKPRSEHPLFPRFGHHWSYYGECIAVDTILSHIEGLHGTDLPDLRWSKIEVVDTARSRDADVLKSMNLWRNPPQNMLLAYPELEFEQNPAKNGSRVLTVSDSYWYGPVYMGVPQNCFANGQFWYYFNKVVPAPGGVKTEVWELDLRREIESYGVIMLLYSDGNLPTFGSGFIQEVYEMYTDPAGHAGRKEKKRSQNMIAKQIRESPLLLKKATAKSEQLQVSLDSAIILEARRMAGLN